MKSDRILTDFSEDTLVSAIMENLVAFLRLMMSHYSQGEMLDSPSLFRFTTGLPYPLMNGVLRADVAPEAADDCIKETMRYFRERSLPALWWVGPDSRPSDLGDRLQAYGLSPAGDVPGMALDLLTMEEDVPQPPGLAIQEVDSTEALEQWLRPLSIAFEFPQAVAEAFREISLKLGSGKHSPVRSYLGLLDGQPAACSSLFLGAGVAGIYNVATMPEARGKGIASALVHRPLREARALGYRIGILQSSEMGHSVYRKLGFQDYCTLDHYLWPGEGESLSSREEA